MPQDASEAEILKNLSLLEIAGETVVLITDATGLRATCPFHPDPSASLYFSNRDFFYCFSCRRGGGILKWTMAHDGLDRHAALERLKKRVTKKTEP